MGPSPTWTPVPTADPFPDAQRLAHDNGEPDSYSELWGAGEAAGIVLHAPPGAYPLRLLGAEALFLDTFPGAVHTASVSLVVFSVDAQGTPKSEIGHMGPFSISTFYPDWALLDISALHIDVSEPFMIAIQYMEGVAGSTPSVLMDSTKNIAKGLNWYSLDRGATWDEHYVFWEHADTVGHNMIRAIVEPAQ